MATLTTLSAAMGVGDQSALLAAVAGLAAGTWIQIDGEEMKVIAPISTAATVPQPVLRGQNGTFNQAHPVSAQVKILIGPTNLSTGDYPLVAAPGSLNIAIPPVPIWERRSYSAAGAITLPSLGNHMIAVLNGTVALAMTLANPSIGQDGARLLVIGNGKAAHTVTYTAGMGNVGVTADVVTMSATQAQGLEYVACGGFWEFSGINTAVAGAGATIDGVGLG
jgi:hypothetical protein